LDGVTVEGMMPKGAKGTAHEVTQDYAKHEALMVGLDKESARAAEAGTLEVAPLVAYDITLGAGGKEYQPDEDHPLTVTITNSAIDDAVAAGKDMQVWHIADDDTVEVIKDFTIADDSIMFKASGFSTYLLVTKGETSGSATPPSSTFGITSSVKPSSRDLNARSADVRVANENTSYPLRIQSETYPDSTSFEVSLAVKGDYADKTRTFEFELTIPQGMSQLVGTKGNESVVLKDGNTTFTLADGQAIRFTNVPKADYTLSQTKIASYSYEAQASNENVTVDTTATPTDGNKFVMKLSNISGTSDSPARVTITNTLANTADTAVPATGIDDNVIVWAAIIAGSIFLMALAWRSRRFVR
jgi:hypothetical protein